MVRGSQTPFDWEYDLSVSKLLLQDFSSIAPYHILLRIYRKNILGHFRVYTNMIVFEMLHRAVTIVFFFFSLSQFDFAEDAGNYFPGKVHKGFYQYFHFLLKDVLAEIKVGLRDLKGVGWTFMHRLDKPMKTLMPDVCVLYLCSVCICVLYMCCMGIKFILRSPPMPFLNSWGPFEHSLTLSRKVNM